MSAVRADVPTAATPDAALPRDSHVRTRSTVAAPGAPNAGPMVLVLPDDASTGALVAGRSGRRPTPSMAGEPGDRWSDPPSRPTGPLWPAPAGCARGSRTAVRA